MKIVLHISADFPDPMAPAKTKAVANLLGLVGGFRHIVYSLNRLSWHRGVRALPFAERTAGRGRKAIRATTRMAGCASWRGVSCSTGNPATRLVFS